MLSYNWLYDDLHIDIIYCNCYRDLKGYDNGQLIDVYSHDNKQIYSYYGFKLFVENFGHFSFV